MLGREQLQFVDKSLKRVVEPGRFTVYVGGDPSALLNAEFEVGPSVQ